MSYTLAAAASATGLNKTTVLRAIKSGKITGTKNGFGEWLIEPAELHRVYPPIEAAAEGNGASQRCAPPLLAPDAELRLRASLAEQRLSDLKAALEDMREQRDKWQTQAERLATGLITDQRPWWRRIVGK